MFQNMMGQNGMQRMIDRMFKRVDGVVWDLMSGNVGIQTKTGIIVRGNFDKPEDGATEVDFDLTENMFEAFVLPIPAFAQNTPRDKVQLGDLVILGNGAYGWITKINPKSYTVKKTDGTTTTWSPPKVETIGMNVDGIMVVRSLMAVSGGQDNLQAFQSSLMPLMMMAGDKGNDKLNSILPMMLMMQSGGVGGNNMMMGVMMASMMSGKGSDIFK